MKKTHRYLITLALPIAALFSGLDGLQAAVGRTLRDLGIESLPSSDISAEVPILLRTSAELDANQRARVIAAIEQEYSRVGATVTDFAYQGSDSESDDPEAPEAPVPVTSTSLSDTTKPELQPAPEPATGTSNAKPDVDF